MLIIGNIKDYYDYLAGVYGVDNHVVLDRRGFVPFPCSLDEIVRHRIVGKSCDGHEPRKLPGHVYALLEIGVIQYFFKLHLKWGKKQGSQSKLFGDYEIAGTEWELLEKQDNHTHIGRTDGIVTISIEDNFATTVCRAGHWVKFEDRGWGTPTMKNMIENLEAKRTRFTVRNFFLSDLKIQKVIPAEEAWRGIYSYLLSLKTPKTEDKRTDVEKLTSKGFDAKTSFRQ